MMKKLRKDRFALLLVFITLLALVFAGGCGNSPTQQADFVTLATAGMLGEGDPAAGVYQQLVADFMVNNPAIAVEDQSAISTEEWKAGIVSRFAKDATTPDVIFYFTGADVKELILAEKFVSVEEIQQSYPQYAQNIRPSTMNFVKEFDDLHYSVPVRGFWEGLFCNTDLFAQYELPLPTDWDSLLNAVQVFRRHQVLPIAASLSQVPHYWIEHCILAQGGAMEHRLDPSGYVAESWALGLQEFKRLYDLEAFPENTMEILDTDAVNLFVQKEAAMILEGSWMLPSIEDKEHTVVLPIPKTNSGKKEYTDIISGFSSGFYISKVAWNDPAKQQAAVEFVLHMTSNESIAAICALGGAPAADISSSNDDNVFAKSQAALQANAKNAIMPIDSRLSKESWQYFCRQIPPLMQNRITPAELILEVGRLNQQQS